MSELRDFLNWFEGFSENIGKQPKPDQWEKIKTRIMALKAFADQPVVLGPSPFPPAPAPAPALQKPTTEAQWKSQYIHFMCELGCDIDTAKEFADDMESVDIGKDPKASAETDFNTMVN